MKRGSSSRSRTKAAHAIRPRRAVLRVVAAVVLACSGLGAGAVVVGYQRARLDVESLQAGIWNIPTRLFPGPLDLAVGSRVPAGPLPATLRGLGYVAVPKATARGQFAVAADGTVTVFPLQPWPGLEGAAHDVVVVKVQDGQVMRLTARGGALLERAVLVGLPVAEIRGPDAESRRPVPLAQMPAHLVDAVVATEDKRFLEHGGVDFRGLARAVVHTLAGRRQGGSTITQQLAKNVFLTHERTLTRKIKEMFYALALEQKHSKDQILEMYLNEIYLGQRGSVSVCGMAQAANAYFSKEVKELTLEESALLAGMIQSPNGLAPDRHPKRAMARRNLVLDLMLAQGRITSPVHQRAVAQPVRVRLGPLPERFAPYVADDVSERVLQMFPNASLQTEGYVIETTLDPRIQRAAEAALNRGLARARRKARVPINGAVLVVHPTTGAVLAMVGGSNYAQSQFNRATQARRQTGSILKPLVVLAALNTLEEEVGPTTVIEDAPLTITMGSKSWTPRNSDGKFHGSVTLRQVLEQSLNVPTVRLSQRVGLPRLVTFLRSLGITAPLSPVPSLALGAYEISPLEVAGAFTVVAGKGVYHPPYVLRRVVDAQGKVLFEHQHTRSKAVHRAEAYMVRDMMRSVVDHGTARSARAMGYSFPASGKTGTTSDNRDAWFVGLDGDLLAVVWVGNDDNHPTGLTGGGAALPVWVDLMKQVRGNQPPPEDPIPQEDLVVVEMCQESMQRAAPSCPLHHRELFWKGTEPTSLCSRHSGPLEQVRDTLLRAPQNVLDLFADIVD